MAWSTVFELQPTSYGMWVPLVAAIVLVTWSLYSLVRFSTPQQQVMDEAEGWKGRAEIRLGLGVLVGVAVVLFMALRTIAYYDVLQNGQRQFVEGPVRDLVSDNRNESFSVKGVRFTYGDNDLTPCFGGFTTREAPLDENLPVRIRYVREPAFGGRNCIIRLEVRRAPRGIPRA